jgi:ribosomal peptide maturation radical SAM protein 1
MTAMQRISLISLPWTMANRPSLQLGVLKSYVERFGGCVEAFHLHLPIACLLGRDLYHYIAMNWQIGETLFAQLVYPHERATLSARLCAYRTVPDRIIKRITAPDFVEELGEIVAAELKKVTDCKPGIIGFTVSHMQLMASVYAAQFIKTEHPDCLLLFGGSGVAGETADAVLKTFPAVDCIVDGEGEIALAVLSSVNGKVHPEILDGIPNLVFHDASGCVVHTSVRTLGTLDGLPAPDFSEYFNIAKREGIPSSSVIVGIEASRGCVWEYRNPQRSRPCSFCGLNRHWHGYREKSLRQIIDEIEIVSRQHRVFDFSFSDSCLPPASRKQLLKTLAAAPVDVSLFCEMRADLDEETVELLSRNRIRRVQLGVESLHTGILQYLRKGAGLLDNLTSMKLCEEYRIPYQYNILSRIPGLGIESVQEQTKVMRNFFGFSPPHLVPFFLSRGSPMHRDPAAFGIDAQHSDCSHIMQSVTDHDCVSLYNTIPFQPSDTSASTEWSLLETVVAEWRNCWERARKQGYAGPLTYRLGRNFAMVTDLRGITPQCFALEGFILDVFLLLSRPTLLTDALNKLDKCTIGDFTGAVKCLSDQNLIVEENQRFLVLPIHQTFEVHS